MTEKRICQSIRAMQSVEFCEVNFLQSRMLEILTHVRDIYNEKPIQLSQLYSCLHMGKPIF